MMTLKSRIQNDIISHMKAGNTFERDTLRHVLGKIQSAEKGGKTPKEFTDAALEAFLASQIKTRRATAADFARLGQTERAAQETAEADLISEYLPQPLSRAEVEVIINTAFAAFENPNMRDIMQAVNAVVKGRYSGKEISDIVKERLA